MKLTLLLVLLMALPCCAQTSTGKAETAGACSPAISGNNNQVSINCPGMSKAQAEKMSSILNKILANQIDPTLVMAKLDEILKAVNPNARITTYNCHGNLARSSEPGRMVATFGDDSVFQEMGRLYDSKQFPELLRLSLIQIQSKPQWLTPRLFSSLAYLNLDQKDKAKEMLREFDSRTGPAYEEEPCKQILEYLHSKLL